MLKEDDVAPDFTLLNQKGEDVSLSELKGKWTVLYFYPKDNTPGCTIEAIDFTASKKEFEQLGAVVLGISPDSVKSHAGFCEKKSLTITLLSDESKDVLKKYGVWDKKKFMGREYIGVIRSTFLIDPKGNVVVVWSPVKVKGHVEEVLDQLKKRSKKI
jgi:thioredoxin-dependent peroxiredoxin